MLIKNNIALLSLLITYNLFGQIVLKELRETLVCLKIIYRAKLYKSQDDMNLAMNENDELISIFVRSVETAQKNQGK